MPSLPRSIPALLLAAACGGGDPPGDDDTSDDDTSPTAPGGVPAVLDLTRPVHYFDVPFPSDGLLRTDGTPDLAGFPRADGELLGAMIGGWVDRAGLSTQGFAANGPVYFRFEGPLSVPDSTAGGPDDPVLLVDVATGERFPLSLRFVEDPGDDPFLAPHTLIALPALGHTPPSGATLAAVVMPSAGAAPPAGWTAPAQVEEAMALSGIPGTPAIATVYTVQESAGQLRALAADVDRWVDEEADWSAVTFRRVARLAYGPGLTPSGQEATLCTATFEDGGTDTAYMARSDAPEATHEVDLGDDWPMAVYQGELPIPYYSGLEDQPYMEPGVSHLLDVGRYTGWIDFAGDTLLTVPDTDRTRLVVSLPKGPGGAPLEGARVLIADHGTGGTAYNSVQRKDSRDQGRELAARLADAGFAVVGRDQPFYGTRFPLVDQGFTDGSLGFYNIVNLTAFRDNQRQAGIEGHAVLRFVQRGLDAALPEGGIDPEGVRRFGHSLGSVTAHNGLAAAPDAWDASFVSGPSAVFALSFLETGLAETGSGIFDTLSDLFGVEVGPDADLGTVIAAALGVDDPDARARFDRMHPAVMLFQWIVDPSDPSTFARDLTVPETLLMGVGDWQVPNAGTEALAAGMPDADLVPCEAAGEYDPHYCLYREPPAWAVFSSWLSP